MNPDPRIISALNVINTAQQEVWNLHHQVKTYDEQLGMRLWEQSLQIESALLKLNELLLGGSGYYENS